MNHEQQDGKKTSLCSPTLKISLSTIAILLEPKKYLFESIGMDQESIKMSGKHGIAKARASGRKSKKISSCNDWGRGGTERGKDPTFVLAESTPVGVEEGDGAELPRERRLECSHPGRLLGEAAVMAGG